MIGELKTLNIPAEDDEPVFETPWEARIFALTVQLAKNQHMNWDEFRKALVIEIAAGDAHHISDGSAYYRAWLAATEKTMSDSQCFSPYEMEQRMAKLSHANGPGKLSPTGQSPAPVAEH
jgi:nitrile hydratase accessory protein